MNDDADPAPLGEGEEMLRRHRRHLLVLVLLPTTLALLAGWLASLDSGRSLLLGLVLLFGSPFLLLILVVAGFLISRDGWRIGACFTGRGSHLIRWSGPLALITLLLSAPAACTIGAQARDHALLAFRADGPQRHVADHETRWQLGLASGATRMVRTKESS